MVIVRRDERKALLAYTSSRVYRLPLERCFRFHTCRLVSCKGLAPFIRVVFLLNRDCVGSQDPYCVWNDQMRQCESTLSAMNDEIGQVSSW